MAFKMKGSAFKLGNVATKSVLKQKTEQKTDPGYVPKKRTKKEVGESLPKGKEGDVGQNPLPQKSALKQKNELHENIKKRLNTGEDLTEAERVEMLKKLKADYKKEGTEKSRSMTKTIKDKAPLPQKLSIGEKLGAAKDAIAGVHPESGLGSLYDMYKTGKKSRREEKRKGKMNKKVEPIKRFTKTVKPKTTNLDERNRMLKDKYQKTNN